jgi:hypothetical protein
MLARRRHAVTGLSHTPKGSFRNDQLTCCPFLGKLYRIRALHKSDRIVTSGQSGQCHLGPTISCESLPGQIIETRSQLHRQERDAREWEPCR